MRSDESENSNVACEETTEFEPHPKGESSKSGEKETRDREVNLRTLCNNWFDSQELLKEHMIHKHIY